MIVPARHQPDLPLERLILAEAPGDEAIPLDVLFVGAGPAGLAGAIRLAQLAREAGTALEIGVLEKAAALGEHSLSGAVVDPRPLRALFPGLADAELPLAAPVRGERVYWLSERGRVRLPPPPPMRNHGHFVASICEIVRWLGARAEELGVNVFTGFPAASLLVRDRAVTGVRTVPSGLDRDGRPGSGHTPAADLSARVTVLCDGTRSALAQAWLRWQGVDAPNPQIYALGVKELWEVPSAPEHVIHTMGWPLPADAFGGSFCYPLGPRLVSLGLVVGLDYRPGSLDVHELTQRLKLHPLFGPIFAGGELQEWGAKTIPEGGWWSLPERLHGDGVLIAGDAAGLVNVAALKGIHYAMQSGILAAETAFRALGAGEPSAAALAGYDRALRASFIGRDLYRTRNMRLAFKSGFYRGGIKAAAMAATSGALFGSRIATPEDAAEPRRDETPPPFAPDGKRTFSKVDAVFRSGNKTRDDVPSHLTAAADVPPELGRLYARLCPAGVYEWQDGGLVVNAPNCVDCKATDVLGPRWAPREGGSGPAYKRM